VIERYLRELAEALPPLRRRRVLAEVEAHLADAAARYEAAGRYRGEAEELAVAEFGPADVVARRLTAELAHRASRPAAALVLAAAVLFVVPLYGLPENTLPPAPWEELPAALEWKRDLAVALWLVAVGLAALGLLLRRPVLSVAALVCVAGSAVLSAVLAVDWNSAAPATPLATLLALTLPLALAAVVVPGAALAYVRRLELRGRHA
jgi:hypothetical protein